MAKKDNNKRDLQVTGGVAAVVVGVGVVFYHLVESMTWIDAFYFSVITLTTVGYGDIAPQTDAGKLFTVLYVVAGIGIIAVFARLLLENTIHRRLGYFLHRD